VYPYIYIYISVSGQCDFQPVRLLRLAGRYDDGNADDDDDEYVMIIMNMTMMIIS